MTILLGADVIPNVMHAFNKAKSITDVFPSGVLSDIIWGDDDERKENPFYEPEVERSLSCVQLQIEGDNPFYKGTNLKTVSSNKLNPFHNQAWYNQ